MDCYQEVNVHVERDFFHCSLPVLLGNVGWRVRCVVLYQVCLCRWWRHLHSVCLRPELATLGKNASSEAM